MKHVLGLSFAAAVAFAALAPIPANSCSYSPRGGGSCGGGPVHGAPGPIAGAGLPFVAVGFGTYWLIKRQRKTG